MRLESKDRLVLGFVRGNGEESEFSKKAKYCFPCFLASELEDRDFEKDLNVESN